MASASHHSGNDDVKDMESQQASSFGVQSEMPTTESPACTDHAKQQEECEPKADGDARASNSEQQYRNGEEVMYIYCLCGETMHVTMTELLDHMVAYHKAEREHVKKFIRMMLRKQRYTRFTPDNNLS